MGGFGGCQPLEWSAAEENTRKSSTWFGKHGDKCLHYIHLMMRIRKKGGTERVKRSGVVGDAKYPLCGATEGSETRIGLVRKLIQDLSPQSSIS
jgi:hypothetical protein